MWGVIGVGGGLKEEVVLNGLKMSFFDVHHTSILLHFRATTRYGPHVFLIQARNMSVVCVRAFLVCILLPHLLSHNLLILLMGFPAC